MYAEKSENDDGVKSCEDGYKDGPTLLIEDRQHRSTS